jgi:membrane protease YdiL (CAAX protease family)
MQTQHTLLKKIWLAVPLWIRAILVGFTVSTLGVSLWVLSASIIPIPWSAFVMIIILWVFWKYFSGSWFPKKTQSIRKENFRRTKMSAFEWKWGITAALIFVIFLHSGLALSFRFAEFPEKLFEQEYAFITQIPTWAAWIMIITASLVAGICEEIGFRGYMQVPLEKKYGPKVGILIVSVVFVIVHLHQAWSGPIVIQIFIVSLLIGIFAYAFNSLIPGIIAHVILDIFNFSYWWSDLLGEYTLMPVSETGLDLSFFIILSIVILSLVSFILICKKMIDMKKQKALALN